MILHTLYDILLDPEDSAGVKEDRETMRKFSIERDGPQMWNKYGIWQCQDCGGFNTFSFNEENMETRQRFCRN
jgi:hypothetical protein